MDASEHIVAADPAFAGIVATAGAFAPRPPVGDHFGALVRAIVYQQLAGRAAAAIHERFLALFEAAPTPEAVLALSESAMRTAGLSGNKTAAILDLALKVAQGHVPLGEMAGLGDEEIVTALCAVRGIGRWTAEMFLLFELSRPDVWPVDDFAVRKGYALIHDLAEMPKPKELATLGEIFRPYRSVAAWYCWRAVSLS